MQVQTDSLGSIMQLSHLAVRQKQLYTFMTKYSTKVPTNRQEGCVWPCSYQQGKLILATSRRWGGQLQFKTWRERERRQDREAYTNSNHKDNSNINPRSKSLIHLLIHTLRQGIWITHCLLHMYSPNNQLSSSIVADKFWKVQCDLSAKSRITFKFQNIAGLNLCHTDSPK